MPTFFFCSNKGRSQNRSKLRRRFLAGIALNMFVVASAAAQRLPAQSAQPTASDSGAVTSIATIYVHGHYQKADLSGFSNSSKTSGQTYKLTATQTQTRITQREILETTIPVGSVSDAIRNQPNVFTPTTTSPIVGGNIYIRGFSKSFLNITLDGIPLNLIDNYTVYSNQIIPFGLIGSIDIKPGAGSAKTVGYSNFGGSIDINSAQPTSYANAVIEGGVGSFGERKTGITLNSGKILGGTTTVIGTFNRQTADGYFNRGADGQHIRSGRVPGDDQYAFKSVSQIGPGVLTGLVSHTSEDFDVIKGATLQQIQQYGPRASALTGAENSSTFWANNFKKEDNLIAYLNYTFSPIYSTIISEQPYYWNGMTYVDNVPTKAPYHGNYFQKNSLYRDFRFGNILKAKIYLASFLTIQTGIWVDATHFVATQPVSALKPGYPDLKSPLHQVDETTTTQPYISVPIAVTNRLEIVPGVKLSVVSRTFKDLMSMSGYQKNWTNVLPSLGANYIIVGTKNAPSLSVYTNYTRTFQPPAFSQISTSAQNFDLAPDLADSFEAGTMWDKNFWSGKVSLFETHFLNYIQTETISNAAHPGGINAYTNAGGAIYQGADISNSFNLTKKIGAFVNVGLLDAHFTSQKAPLTYAPHQTGSVGLRYQGQSFQSGVTLDYNSGYFINQGKSLYTGLHSYKVVDFFADYKLPVHAPHIDSAVVSLNINNMFNKHYIVDGGSFNGKPVFYYALPMNIFADLKVRFR